MDYTQAWWLRKYRKKLEKDAQYSFPFETWEQIAESFIKEEFENI